VAEKLCGSRILPSLSEDQDIRFKRRQELEQPIRPGGRRTADVQRCKPHGSLPGPFYSLKPYALHSTVDELMDNRDETRRRSAALFGTEKTVEVVLALHEEAPATAQMIAVKTGITYSLVRDALLRLAAGGAIRLLPRLGGRRSPQYYEPVDGDLWIALTSAARAVMAAERSHST